jgi:hypothetical protein
MGQMMSFVESIERTDHARYKADKIQRILAGSGMRMMASSSQGDAQVDDVRPRSRRSDGVSWHFRSTGVIR